MTRLIASFSLLALLAACGADGEPTAPPAKPNVAVSGEVAVGVTGKL